MSLSRLQTLHSDHLGQAALNFVSWHPSLTELNVSIPKGHAYKFPHYLYHSPAEIIFFLDQKLCHEVYSSNCIYTRVSTFLFSLVCYGESSDAF
jgi:hypothetical protein